MGRLEKSAPYPTIGTIRSHQGENYLGPLVECKERVELNAIEGSLSDINWPSAIEDADARATLYFSDDL